MSKTLKASEKNNGVVAVQRRFLLFQLDLKNAALRSFGGVNPFDGQVKPDLPGAFKFADPLEWEDPNADEYWRNILDQGYTEKLNAKWAVFKENFFAALDKGDIDLRRGPGGNGYRDITDLVKTVSGYSVSLEDFSNELTITLASPNAQNSSGEIQSFVSFKGQASATGSTSSAGEDTQSLELTRASISENDVIMVRTSRDGGRTFYLEYLGFVSVVNDANSYGQLDSKTLTVSGVSKLFSLSTIIKQKAIGNTFEQVGVNINKEDTPAVLEHLFQGKNAKEITSELLNEVMAWQEVTLKQTATGAGQNPNALLYRINENQFSQSTGNLSFQFNIFTLLTLYLMSRSVSTDTTVFPLPQPGTALPVESENVYNESGVKIGTRPVTGSQGPSYVLDKATMAVMEHGDHIVWNETVASGFENFFSQTTLPSEIFGDLRTTTYYDVFESRDGTVIVRPPRYNRIEESLTEYTREFLDTTESQSSIEKILRLNGQTGNFEFNPAADYYIPAELSDAGVDVQRDDTQLETRADAKWTMPYVGPVDFPAGAYQDPGLLLRYGLRTQGPVNNPNVTNDDMAALFAPVVLGMINAKTRRASFPVRDVRDFRVGKLYYIESIKSVAYLVSDGIGMGYSQVGKRDLSFSMVRRVVDIKISDIRNSENLRLNFALMYLKDPSSIAALSDGDAITMKTSLDIRAIRMLDHLAAIASVQAAGIAAQQAGPQMASQAAASVVTTADKCGATIPMFRYVPTILDVIVDIDDNPALAKPNKTDGARDQSALNKLRADLGVEQAVNIDGQFFSTEMPFSKSTLTGVNPAEIQKVAAVGAGGNPDQLVPTAKDWAILLAKATLYLGSGGLYDFDVKNPDSEWGNFNPRCGLAGYGNVRDPAGLVEPGTSKPYRIYGEDLKLLPLLSTPFFSYQIASNPAAFLFSQSLVNRLSVLDLTMKYRKASGYVPNIEGGFPQYYTLSGEGQYQLFGGSLGTPSEYARKNSIFSTAFMVNVLEAVSNNPNALFYDGTKWLNQFFEIQSAGSGRFNMPFGHVMVASSVSVDGNKKIVPRFVYLSGGEYSFTYEPGNTGIVIQALSQGATVAWDDVASVAGTSGASSLALEADKKVLENKTVRVPILALKGYAANRLFCFLSPFMEPTVERMLEHALPPDLGGYRTNKNTNTLVTKSPTKVLGENDSHLKGQGLDLCVETLVYDSASDLVALPGVGTRMKNLMVNCGFDNTGTGVDTKPPVAFNWIQNPENVKISWSYPDGKPGGTAAAGNQSPASSRFYFHIGVTDREVLGYVTRVNKLYARANPKPTGGGVDG